jgi:hypothetical protein
MNMADAVTLLLCVVFVATLAAVVCALSMILIGSPA